MQTTSGENAGSPASQDLSGRDRLARNVLASWGAHSVLIAVGFIMPRMIDQHIGQDALGVWDFAWSVVNYLGVVQMGVGSSVSPFVAKYRACGDVDGINRTVASVMCVQVVAAAGVLLLTMAVVLVLPHWLEARLGRFVHDAQYVIFFLGCGLAAQLACGVFVGVITGCHRWDLHNLISAGSHALIAAGMIICLLAGGGLRGIAATHCAGILMAEFARALMAYRVLPRLTVRLRNARWATAGRRLLFGGKTLLPRVADTLLHQTTLVMILAVLGPGALALFCRPLSLVRHVRTLSNKFAFVLTPTASSLHASGESDELGAFLTGMSRYGFLVAFPMVLLIAILGEPLIHVWMGKEYVTGGLCAVLAMGFLATVTQEPLASTLQGINAHGRPGLLRLLGAIIATGSAFFALYFLRLGLTGAAAAIAVPLTIVDGVLIPLYACRRIQVPFSRFVAEAVLGPIGLILPYAAWLLTARLLLADRPLVAVLVGGAGGLGIISWIYWKYVIPERLRDPAKRAIDGFLRRR